MRLNLRQWIGVVATISLAPFFAPSSAKASYSYVEGEAAGTIFVPMSGADHFKYGARLALLGVKYASWTPWLVIDTGLAGFSTVNPGAGPTATEPNLQESSSTSQPVLARLLVRTPYRFGSGFRLVTGLTWYYADFHQTVGSSIPNAPTIGFYWQKPSKQWVTELYTGLSVNPLGSAALLLVPEIALRGKVTGDVAFRGALRVPVFRSFVGGVVGVQPSISVGLIVGY